MSKNILIIGGSYFIGKVSALILFKNKEFNLHLLNRGTHPLRVDGISELICDRHDLSGLQTAVPDLEYDAVVDFCALESSDVEILLDNIRGTVKQYIHISSCTVYQPSLDYPKHEASPLLTEKPYGPAGEYAFNKRNLEAETAAVCSRLGIPFTIFRPAFVYGPYNYAPRESFFFKLILSGSTIPVPDSSLALFQFVYVKDIARFIEASFDNENCRNQIYNLSAPELISYGKLIEVLEEISERKIITQPYSIETIDAQNIPLPFPIDQHELFSGQKATDAFDIQYTKISQGMQESFDFYKKYVYR